MNNTITTILFRGAISLTVGWYAQQGKSAITRNASIGNFQFATTDDEEINECEKRDHTHHTFDLAPCSSIPIPNFQCLTSAAFSKFTLIYRSSFIMRHRKRTIKSNKMDALIWYDVRSRGRIYHIQNQHTTT